MPLAGVSGVARLSNDNLGLLFGRFPGEFRRSPFLFWDRMA